MSIGQTMQHKIAGIPAWGWAAIIGAGGAAAVVVIRRSRGTGTKQDDGLSSYGPLTRDGLTEDDAGALGDAGGAGGTAPPPTGRPPAIDKRGWDKLNKQIDDALKGPTTGDSPNEVGSPNYSPRRTLKGLVPLKDVPQGIVVGRGNVSNPVGSAMAQAGRYYTPSQMDLASESPGGLNFSVISPNAQAMQAGQTYSVYTGVTGTGPAVAPAQRISGERYDLGGRIIY